MKVGVLGAGFTGLGAAIGGNLPVFEAREYPGGICASYEREGFRFEIGGGHWIFGGDPLILRLFHQLSPLRRYRRRSAVFFTGALPQTAPFAGKFVDYPIQNHLHQLGDNAAQQALRALVAGQHNGEVPYTMEQWLQKSFGEYLCEIFFFPFHQRYTAGLYTTIAPQDPYKTPLNIHDVIQGAFQATISAVGYNVEFAYPAQGLNHLAQQLAAMGHVTYARQAVKINLADHVVYFSDGSHYQYDLLLSTIPLNHLVKISTIPQTFDEPYTSVLVLNLGVVLPSTDRARHRYHWLYVPDSRTGFHRIGYYSNVEPEFLPENCRDAQRYASLYVEFAFANGVVPSSSEIEQKIENTVQELQDLGLIQQVIVADPTWIDVAYTWRKPDSKSVQSFLVEFQQQDVFPIGRYGRWRFQGIAESFQEGLNIGAQIRAVGRVLSADHRVTAGLDRSD